MPEFVCRISTVKHNYKRPWSGSCTGVCLIISPGGHKQMGSRVLLSTPAWCCCLCLPRFGKLFCFQGFGGKGKFWATCYSKDFVEWEKKVNVKVKEALVHICLLRKTIDLECGNRYRGICCSKECCIETLHSRSGLHSHGDLEWFLAISLENACQFLISALKEDVNCTLQNILQLVLPSGCF